MKIDKEYPATHSMSTAWYIVDDEGNVGILDYNENGPVPWGVEETDSNDLMYGHCEDWRNHKFLRFDLTEQQVLDTLQEPHKPSEEDMWYDCVVKIDIEKTSRFLELCDNSDISKDETVCLSESLGLYKFDAFDCTQDRKDGNISIHGTLKTILQENIILEVYRIQYMYMDDQYENGEVVHKKEFNSSPYYMFHQPYWTEALPKKLHEPEHPVKLQQIPERFRHRLHKIPGRFDEMETFQIAQYHPCEMSSCAEDSIFVVDGCSYKTVVLPDGSSVYAKTGMCQFQFYPFCSEKNRFHCSNKCSTLCCDIEDCLLTDKPTVLLIFDPKEGPDYIWKVLTDKVIQKSYATSYIPKFPYRIGNTDWCLKSDVEKFMTAEYLYKVFKGSHEYIENIILDINPRVILVTDRALDVFQSVYSIESNSINVNGVVYPAFNLSSLNSNRTFIEKLAELPYQGKRHPQIISIDEMKQLVQQGLAKVYSNIL